MSFTSELGDAVVIDESNAHEFVHDSGYVERDWDADPLGSEPCAPLNTDPTIPRDDWDELIEQGERTKTFVNHLLDREGVPFKYQASTNFCASNATICAGQAAQVVQGQAFRSWSPASVACPITGFVNKGHWPKQVVAYLSKYGAVPSTLWPDNEINESLFKPTFAARDDNRVAEWTEQPRFSFEHLMTAMLKRQPTAAVFMWMKHVVCALYPVKLPGSDHYGIGCRNSYGPRWNRNGYLVIDEAKANADEMFSVRVVTGM